MWSFRYIKKKMRYSVSLRKNEEFKEVYKNGRYAVEKDLILHVKKNELGINRIGISVSKKTGNSVVRHRIKRLVKEAYRLNEEKFICGYDLVFSARKDTKDRTYLSIESVIFRLAKRAGILK